MAFFNRHNFAIIAENENEFTCEFDIRRIYILNGSEVKRDFEPITRTYPTSEKEKVLSEVVSYKKLVK